MIKWIADATSTTAFTVTAVAASVNTDCGGTAVTSNGAFAKHSTLMSAIYVTLPAAI